ncbi:replication endonuclease [Vibrio anguillarum]|uniref:replication endonuclease n=2 Tax=Vibrio anguillarum TaxID=55601 RepID=UPI001889C3DB|nr:replication endonuclease [Vibrio anguillarum]MBF4256086.1 replication endonuclease [Vibrio anguillarum]MBF4298171.1 replication endonuclease [Vibrio anguillarum]MBF4397486.1 replication endonuclease [Vibrio anguillarum]MBF4438569.1 replication endonuclease [Vibrio anguillarum]
MSCLNLTFVDRDDRAFVEQRLSPFPLEIQHLLLNKYLRQPSKFERNTYLRVTTDNIARKLSIPLSKLELNLSEDDLRAKAKHLAKSTLALRRQYLDDELALYPVRLFVQQQGINQTTVSYSLNGELSRYGDHKWWLRKIRKSLRQNIEAVLHHLNQVNKQKSLYCSNPTLIARIRQKDYQRAYLENTIATNELGQSFSLLELSQKGVSDPKIRKGELMMRARGFEELAKELGHEATFLTITCPSKYHRSYSKSGHENPKWEGYTPLDGQQYLNNIWQLIRSKLNRLNIRFYGFRVAEPQHDGTPHWHLLLFVEPSRYDEMVNIMREYALREDGDESGATEHRFTEVKIDPSKGSATGYIAKYISKNIDGSDLEDGVYGEDPRDAAARVDAWASCWGIRQFQQLGGCSVTVWRELRRLKCVEGLSQLAKEIVEAADSGNWKVFTKKMGGVFSLRKEQVFKPYYELLVDRGTGVVKTSQYCDSELMRALKGVFTAGREIITRVFQWRIDAGMRHAF